MKGPADGKDGNAAGRRPASRARDNGRDRQKRILSAANALFFEKGYRGTTMEQIARRAGYSKRSVYLDYLNKDDLFIGVCAIGMELLLTEMRRIPKDISLMEFVEAFLDCLGDFSRRHSKYLWMFAIEATPEVIANCSNERREQVALLEREGFEIVVAQVQRAVAEKIIPPVDPWEVAGILIGSVTGIALLSLGGSQTVFSQATLESMGKKAGLLILKGLFLGPPSEELPAEPHFLLSTPARTATGT